MRKAIIFGVILSVILTPLVKALTTQITKGQITELGSKEFLTDYGMVRGSIRFKLGDYSWGPKEIWFLPEGTEPKQFKSVSVYLEIPDNIIFSTCKTSVYYNESLGYAFKLLSSAILENGTFCGLAYEGNYTVLAK